MNCDDYKKTKATVSVIQGIKHVTKKIKEMPTTSADVNTQEMITQINKEEETKKVSVKAILETEKKEDPKKKEQPIKESKREIPPPQRKEETVKHFNAFFDKK